MKVLWRSLLFLLITGASAGQAQAELDPRVFEAARLLEFGGPTRLCELYFCSDWTKTVLQSLSKKEQKHLANQLRKMKKPVIREGRLEQYRRVWRSRDEPDSECVVSYPLDKRPDALSRPMFSFSSRVEEIPALLAEALDAGNIPLVLSFHQPLSGWHERIPTWTPSERKNRVQFYRSLRILETRDEERVYKGPYVTPQGIDVQDEWRVRLHQDGRWLVE